MRVVEPVVTRERLGLVTARRSRLGYWTSRGASQKSSLLLTAVGDRLTVARTPTFTIWGCGQRTPA